MDDMQAGDEAPSSPRRISVSAARKMLGMVGRNYSDADLEALLDQLYGIAGSAFERYLDTLDQADPVVPHFNPDLSE